MLWLTSCTVVIILALSSVVLWRAYEFTPTYAPTVSDLPTPIIDSTAAAARLAEAISFRTISYRDPALVDSSSFKQFHRFLTDNYPAFNAVAVQLTVADLSLLYMWEGTDPSLDPLLLAGHLDVTPAETVEQWSTDPFQGAVTDEFVQGRGAIDNKAGVVGIMEAMELLAESGFSPTRTIYLSFGHDEEIGGHQGADAVTRHLEKSGVSVYAVIDEGGIIAHDVLDAVTTPIALVGVAEKGSVNLKLTVENQGGHSSAPPPETSIEVLGAAISKVAAMESQPEITPPVSTFLDAAGPLFPFSQRIFLANRWLFGKLVIQSLLEAPHTAAMVQTSITTTMISGGEAANVLPSSAEAIVNVRLLTGDSSLEAIERIREAIADDRVIISLATDPVEPSGVSPATGSVYEMIKQSIGALSTSRIVVTPYLFVAGSDSKHYGKLSENVYRFSGLQLSGDDLSRIHGVDERVSIASLASAINFYYTFTALATGEN